MFVRYYINQASTKGYVKFDVGEATCSSSLDITLWLKERDGKCTSGDDILHTEKERAMSHTIVSFLNRLYSDEPVHYYVDSSGMVARQDDHVELMKEDV